MERHDLKEFVQSIQNKVSVGVAFAVIRSKPEYFSAKQYAQEIQEKVLQSWIKKRETTVFDDKILEFQRSRIFNQISDLLLPPPVASATFANSPDEAFDIPDVCSDFLWEDECIPSTESDSESDRAGSVQNTISFVEALVQLKFAVESSRAVPAERLRSVIQGKTPALSLGPKVCEAEVVPSRFQSTEDSGFGDSAPLQPRTIPSSIFRWVTHSSHTDGVLRRCVDILLAEAGSRLRAAPIEKFSAWRNSALNKLTSTFRAVAHHPLCATALASFVTSFLDDIWNSQLTSQFTIWEYQMEILADFCCSRYIIESVVDSIMKKFEELSEKLSTEDVYSEGKLVELYLVEQAPLFVGFVSRLLEGWVDQPDAPTTTVVTAITDLWWKEGGRPGKRQQRVSASERWASVCEALVLSSTSLFPLLSFQVWDLLKRLKPDY